MHICLNLSIYHSCTYNHPKKKQQYGAVCGATCVLSFINLETAVFWGQLSNCQREYDWVDGYSCYDTGAMVAVSVFAALLFILEVRMSFTNTRAKRRKGRGGGTGVKME